MIKFAMLQIVYIIVIPHICSWNGFNFYPLGFLLLFEQNQQIVCIPPRPARGAHTFMRTCVNIMCFVIVSARPHFVSAPQNKRCENIFVHKSVRWTAKYTLAQKQLWTGNMPSEYWKLYFWRFPRIHQGVPLIPVLWDLVKVSKLFTCPNIIGLPG